jgi:hypothetical protein
MSVMLRTPEEDFFYKPFIGVDVSYFGCSGWLCGYTIRGSSFFF